MPRRPRLLVVITLAQVGGAQTYVTRLLPALATHFDVTVAAHGPGPLRDETLAVGGRFVELRHVRRPVSPWRDVAGLFELMRLFRTERPDIVHLNSSKAGLLGCVAAFLTRVPVRIFTVNGWVFSWYSGVASRLYLWADRAIGLLATSVICVADQERELGLAARTCRFDRTVVIHNAVDVGAALRASRNGTRPVTLVSVGRLKAPKDFVTLVKALAQLEPGSFRGLVVGDGPDRALIETEIGGLGLSDLVELCGERDDVHELLALADVFVLSTRSEGLPLSILEAMAAGLPVVASAVGGVPELVVDGETGLLVPPDDVAALAAALERLVREPERRRRMGDAGRHRAEAHFDLPAFHRAHLDLYASELARVGAP
jgi:glycosyltransferase involved in cell wall biosynthesis